MNGVRRIVLGLDQGRLSGWGIAPERGRVVRHGLAKSHAERLAVVRLALAFAGEDPRAVFAVFEGHAHMPLSRLTTADTATARKGRSFAPERNTATFIGMGKAYGRWLELLELVGVPTSHVIEVRPQTWRAATHRVQKGPRLKQAAIDWACERSGKVIADDNHAEAYCMTEWGSTHGLARYDAELREARVEARDKRQGLTQGDLFGVGGAK